MSGIPAVDLESRLDDIQRVLSEMSLSTAERSWLKRIESILQSEVEIFRQFESDMGINDGSGVGDDPASPERIWMLRELLLNGQINTLRKIISREKMLSLLPSLQLPKDDLARYEEQVKGWDSRG